MTRTDWVLYAVSSAVVTAWIYTGRLVGKTARKARMSLAK